MTEQDKIVDSSDKEKSISQKIGGILFNQDEPEMITKVNAEEVDKFSILMSLVQEENFKRKQLGIREYNLMGEVIHNNLVLRTSLDGWRAKQGENIVKGVSNEEQSKNEGFGARVNKILNRG